MRYAFDDKTPLRKFDKIVPNLRMSLQLHVDWTKEEEIRVLQQQNAELLKKV